MDGSRHCLTSILAQPFRVKSAVRDLIDAQDAPFPWIVLRKPKRRRPIVEASRRCPSVVWCDNVLWFGPGWN